MRFSFIRFMGSWLLAFAALSGPQMKDMANDPVAAHREAVEQNLRYLTIIKGRADQGMSLQERMAYHHVPGVSIAVIHHGKVEWAKGYGVTRLGGPAVIPATLFNAASMSKPITAMAVLRLVQEKKIDLDADVNSYLKSWKVPENQYTKRHKVTVRELLSHTSGIGTQNGEVVDPDRPIPTIVQMLNGEKPATTGPVRVEAEPGSKFAYANGGYMILQLLVEEVTGVPFARYMRETVLAPLRMSQSTFEAQLTPQQAAIAATGYEEDGVRGIPPSHFMKLNLAAGGLWTTAPDYAKFLIELQKEYAGTSNLILNQATTKMMITPGIGPSESMRWGLGVHVGGTAPNLFFEHGGSGIFQNESIGYLSGDGVVILTSGGGGGYLVDEIAHGVAQVYRWPDFQPIEHSLAKVAPSKYDNFVGTYDFIKVKRNANKLMAEIPLGTQEVELCPESDVRYFLRGAPTTLVFDLDSAGKATGVEFITSVVHWHKNKTQ